MPRLHKYRNRNACYILTAIRGAVVTTRETREPLRDIQASSPTA